MKCRVFDYSGAWQRTAVAAFGRKRTREALSPVYAVQLMSIHPCGASNKTHKRTIAGAYWFRRKIANHLMVRFQICWVRRSAMSGEIFGRRAGDELEPTQASGYQRRIV
jgi:hypothetical protein